MTIRLLTIFFLCLFVVAPTTTNALVASDVSLSTKPEIPGANENVTLSLVSYAIDLNQAEITWKINGLVVFKQIGAKSFSTVTGDFGSRITISATVVYNGDTVTKTLVLEPSDIDLIWEALDSYVPPFYRGKAMPSSEAVIKVVAIPQIKGGTTTLSGNNQTFSWERNYMAQPTFSGFNKNVFTFKSSYLNKKETITLTATEVGTASIAKKTLVLQTGNPKILWYEYQPLLGVVYEKALSSGFVLPATESTLVAEPYFFTPKNAVSNDIRYTWSINGSQITTPEIKNYLTVQKPTGVNGVATISLLVESIPRLFQNANSLLQVTLTN